ncbi:ComEC/Rec2 family competence protein [Pseudarthrobacter sulfonivorans]|uniref:ComEC/Rec2 family competence protein n=1 Tax=Pseudarthrobacter sulfonivorans TaxID=121292 RepID=UPI002106C28B|nr:ComEC/Rec2 family competence protein [Pseudarthrobacter sulfonivorans]
MAKQSPWSRFVDSAVQGPAVRGTSRQGQSEPTQESRTAAAGDSRWRAAEAGRQSSYAGRRSSDTAALRPAVRRAAGRLTDQARKKLRGTDPVAAATDTPRRRTDVRLGLPALLVWGAALAGVWLEPATLALLCTGLVVLAVLLLAQAGRTRTLRARHKSFWTTTAMALMMAAAAAAHAAVSSAQRHDGPFVEAVAAGKSVVAVLEITGSPRGLSLPGQAGPPERWSVPARTEHVTASGNVIHTRADIVVMGGQGWDKMVPGQMVRTAGKLRPPEQGQEEAAILGASMAPGGVSGDTGAGGGAAVGAGAGADADAGAGAAAMTGAVWQMVARELRSQYVAAAAFLASDPSGLLPGMVTGDTSALDPGLTTAMKTVGMTHLTAVSGANCSLVLGALLVAARSLRLPRPAAAALALAGLGLFVVLVGPDASVLRAALMGSIALASLAAGRTGRGLSFLCLAVMGLLLLDPGLATSFGFLLSVLATLGIIVLGPRMMEWTPAVIPRWAAAAVAVPLSAQLLCGPVIVLLQPQFSTYSLPANIAAAPLVAPVTLLGTAAVPLVPLVPWLASALIAVAGTFSAGVAATARTAAGLPGATLPWPEGPFGLLTMVLLSALTLAVVWGAVRPRHAMRLILGLHARTVLLLASADGCLRASRKPFLPPPRLHHSAGTPPIPRTRRAPHARTFRSALPTRRTAHPTRFRPRRLGGRDSPWQA